MGERVNPQLDLGKIPEPALNSTEALEVLTAVSVSSHLTLKNNTLHIGTYPITQVKDAILRQSLDLIQSGKFKQTSGISESSGIEKSEGESMLDLIILNFGDNYNVSLTFKESADFSSHQIRTDITVAGDTRTNDLRYIELDNGEILKEGKMSSRVLTEANFTHQENQETLLGIQEGLGFLAKNLVDFPQDGIYIPPSKK